MKKILLACLALSLLVGTSAWAARSTRAVAQPTAVATPTTSTVDTAEAAEPAAEQNVDAMKPGFSYNFLLDAMMLNLGNPELANSNGSSTWYYYPVYRAMLANVFQNGFAIYSDIEKPGYADTTYPTLKVNELYGKYQKDKFSLKIGRQTFGDTSDLLLGFQNDAVSAAFNLDKINLEFFLAKVDLAMPWDTAGTPTMGGLFGFVPYFNLGADMGLRGYLLVGTESIAVTSGTPATTSDKINALITVGGKYLLGMPTSDYGKFDLAGQLGVQFASAETAAAANIDATNVGFKLDLGYGERPPKEFGFKLGGHMVFTGGVDTTSTSSSVKVPFYSANELVGSGPGMFNKIQDGAGPYTYLDTITANPYGAGYATPSERVQQYAGVFALGLSAEGLINAFDFGLGFWTYSDTYHWDSSVIKTNSLGSELDEWITFQILAPLSIYEQFAVFFPSNPTNLASAPGSATKFVLGSALKF